MRSRSQKRLTIALLTSCIAGACALGDLWDGPRRIGPDPCATPEICGTVDGTGVLTGECISEGDGYYRCVCKGGYKHASDKIESNEPCVIDPCEDSEQLCGGPDRCFHDPPSILPANGTRPAPQLIVGDWRCDCPAGTHHFNETPHSTCIPTDECDFNPPDAGGDTCAPGARCVQPDGGGRRCECDCGFVKGDGGSCTDPCDEGDVCGEYRYPNGAVGRAGVCRHVERDHDGRCRDQDIHPNGIYCDCRSDRYLGFELDGGVCIDICPRLACGPASRNEHSNIWYLPDSGTQYAGGCVCLCLGESTRNSDRIPATNCTTDGGVTSCECPAPYVYWSANPVDEACIIPTSPCEDIR